MPKLVFFLYIHPYLKKVSCGKNAPRIVAPGLGVVIPMSSGPAVMDCCCHDVFLAVESRMNGRYVSAVTSCLCADCTFMDW
jgi:hypothetical protein